MKIVKMSLIGALLAVSGAAFAQDANVDPMSLNHYPYPLDARSEIGLRQLEGKMQLQPAQQAAWSQLVAAVEADTAGAASAVSSYAAQKALDAQLTPEQKTTLAQFRQELLWDLQD
nr:hypothetical protein [Chromobacterium sp. ASV5]